MHGSITNGFLIKLAKLLQVLTKTLYFSQLSTVQDRLEKKQSAIRDSAESGRAL